MVSCEGKLITTFALSRCFPASEIGEIHVNDKP